MTQRCIHCGNPIRIKAISDFCCIGCETVYNWIKTHHLIKFYDLKSKDRPIRKPTPVSIISDEFLYLDHAEFLSLYSWQTHDEERWMDFYLEGVHCAACVWMTEKIPQMLDHVHWVRLNLGSSVASVQITKEGSFASVASHLQKMGYHPHPIKRGESNPLQQKENRLFLIRIGVAAASAGNIMLLAVSVYAGASGEWANLFCWISFILFLPVLFFSAVPFYQNAWKSIRSKELSIDIPVVFGIILGFSVSTVNLFQKNDRVYFDSLSTLVLLLLSTRYLLKVAQQSANDSLLFAQFLVPAFVRKWDSKLQMFQESRLDSILLGDLIQVRAGESIPVDGEILAGSSSVNISLLTGESSPAKASSGSQVFAGTSNIEAPITIKVTQSGFNTRLGRILNSIEAIRNQKAPIASFADRVSRYFVAAVVSLSACTFLLSFFHGAGWKGDWIEGLNRALAIAIVTCPCTFALITPLVFSRILGKLAKAGILVKGANTLEKLTQIQSIFLDKTGTLTSGNPQVTHWKVPRELTPSIVAIESHSSHSIAQAILNYLQSENVGTLPKVNEIKETLGLGIRGQIRDHWIELRRTEEKEGSGIGVSVLKDGIKVGEIHLSDRLKSEAQEAIESFRSLGLDPWILSGDNPISVFKIAQIIDIPPDRSISRLTPEEKAEIIRKHKYVLMVGDGANDALALAQAYVGISIHSGIEMGLNAADVYIKHSNLKSIVQLLIIARETLKIVKRNLGFSILYNLITAAFALAGKINPLTAAILMPLSALTVYLSSLYGTPQMRKALGELSS